MIIFGSRSAVDRREGITGIVEGGLPDQPHLPIINIILYGKRSASIY